MALCDTVCPKHFLQSWPHKKLESLPVAQSSSGGVAISYVGHVLHTTSCFSIMDLWPMQRKKTLISKWLFINQHGFVITIIMTYIMKTSHHATNTLQLHYFECDYYYIVAYSWSLFNQCFFLQWLHIQPVSKSCLSSRGIFGHCWNSFGLGLWPSQLNQQHNVHLIVCYEI